MKVLPQEIQALANPDFELLRGFDLLWWKTSRGEVFTAALHQPLDQRQL